MTPHKVRIVNVRLKQEFLPKVSMHALLRYAERICGFDVVKEMRYLKQNLSQKNLLEHFHDAVQRKEEALSMFKLGFLSLEDKAKVEQIFWQICKVIHKNAQGLKYVPDEVEALGKALGIGDALYLNADKALEPAPSSVARVEESAPRGKGASSLAR